MNFVFTLEELGLQDASRVGEEAASLGEILKIGAHVPAAFVIPTTSYAEYLNYPPIKSILGRCDPSNQNELKAQLLAAPLPQILERSLRSSYRTLSGPRDTFVSVRADISEQKIIGEEELIYNIKKLWAEHLARLCSLEESSSLNPLPILVQQVEVRDVEGRLFTTDPYLADSETVVIEVSHRDGKEKFFLKKPRPQRLSVATRPLRVAPARQDFVQAKSGGKRVGRVAGGGTDQLTKRVVTGVVEEEASLELVSALSSWGTKVEKVLGGPQELEWSFHRGVPAFLSVKPLYLRKRIPAAVKLWVRVDSAKETTPSKALKQPCPPLADEATGIITTTADNAVKLAKQFPTKPVLLALRTVEEEELAIIRRARHRERQKNLHLILPSVRTVDGLREMKRAVAGEGLPRGPHLKFYFQVSFPANVVLLDRFLELEVDGVVFDAKSLIQGFLRTQEPVEPDDSLLWALGEVQRKCKRTNLELLYLGESLSEEVLANLLRKGVTRVVVDAADEEALLSTLATVEGRMLEESGRV